MLDYFYTALIGFFSFLDPIFSLEGFRLVTFVLCTFFSLNSNNIVAGSGKDDENSESTPSLPPFGTGPYDIDIMYVLVVIFVYFLFKGRFSSSGPDGGIEAPKVGLESGFDSFIQFITGSN